MSSAWLTPAAIGIYVAIGHAIGVILSVRSYVKLHAWVVEHEQV